MSRKNSSPGSIAVLPRRKRGNFSMYKIFLTSSFILMMMLLTVLGFQTVQRVKLKQQLQQYQGRIEEYEKRNLATKNEIERLQEPDYIELLARKYLGLVKPGETIFQFED